MARLMERKYFEKEETLGVKSLFNAIRGKNLELIEKILESGADVDEPGEHYKTPLHLAVQVGFLAAVEVLVEYGANVVAQIDDPSARILSVPDKRDWSTPLHLAVSANRLDILKVLLAIKINQRELKKNHAAVLLHASERNNGKVGKILSKSALSKNIVDIDMLDSRGRTLLWIAVQNESTEMIKFLLDNGANMNILRRDDEVNSYVIEETVLHAAIRKGNNKIIDLLLDHKHCDVNASSVFGKTALFLAVSLNNLRIVKALIEKKGDFRADNFGDTPYHMAVFNNAIEITRYFLDTLKIDIHMKTKNGKNAMHFAVQNRNIGMIKMLLDHGFDVNHYQLGNEWHTPVYTAVLCNSSEIFDILVNRGADVHITLKYDCEYNMLNESIKRNNVYLLKKLLSYGIDINKLNRTNFLIENGAFDVLREHIAKLKAANFFVCSAMSELIDEEFYNECEKEATKIKEQKIGKSNVCYIDLLVKDTDQLTYFAMNRNIVEALELEKLKSQFPLYADMLICHFQKGVIQSQMIQNAEEILGVLFNKSLTYDCVSQIVMYLNNVDLFKYSSRNKELL